MSVFQCTLTLPDRDASTLWTLFQDTAGQHIDSLGLGADTMPGLYWVVVRQRMVLYDEIPVDRPLTLRTWMGPARHDLFPRHHALYDGDGGLLCRAASVWALLDTSTRAFGKPPQVLYDAPTREEDGQLPRLTPLRAPKEGQSAAFTVCPEYIDVNGHMNNARYFDAVFAALPDPAAPLREAQVDYIAEALQGDTVSLLWQDLDGVRTVAGDKDGKPCFRMKLMYA